MVVAAFVAPYLLDATTRFVEAAARVPDTELALVTCEPEGNVPSGLRRSLAAHWRIDDALDTGQITSAVQGVSERIGPVQRLLAVLEQLQVPVAQAREHLSIAGMDAGTARNFRDKAQMKSVLRAAGVPCARHRLADSAAAAAGFAKEVGFPLVVKPPAGSGAKSTFRLDDADDLRVWLDAAPPSPDRLALLEEFLSGDEGSYDSVMVDGQIIWDSVSSYLPTPLEVLRNPWIQWMVLLPRAIDGPEYAGIRAIAPTALSALGLHSGLTHLEWFRRPDGTVAVSEVAGAAARRPDHLDAVLRPRLRPVQRLGAAHGARYLRTAGTRLVRRDRVPARAGNGSCPGGARPRRAAGRGELPGRRVAPAGAGPAVLGKLRGRRLHHRPAP
jgi:hypothetical protein